MGLYRKKPVVVQAEQWLPGKDVADVLTEVTPEMSHDVADLVSTGNFGAIKTLEGWHAVTSGDYVITGVKGEKYPCKEDIFLATYEEVSPTDQ